MSGKGISVLRDRPETAPTECEYWKNPRKRWSERRDSNHLCKYLKKRNLPNVSEIALIQFLAV